MAAFWKKKKEDNLKTDVERDSPIGPPIRGTLKIEQVRSPIGHPQTQREVLRGLGLRRIRQVVEREDSPAVRGMVNKIPHLVRIVEETPAVEEEQAPPDRAEG